MSFILYTAAPATGAPLAPDPGRKPAGPQICAKAAAPSSLSLQQRDEERLRKARALDSYLRGKNLNPELAASLYKASARADIDFDLLAMKAMMESDFGRHTIAHNSSARGVFQYIEPTWLTLIKRYGAEMGYPHYAEAIRSRHHRPYIGGKNGFLKAEILSMRHDPDIAALVKAYQIREETDVIRGFKRSKVSAVDHYIVHMLGLSLAREFYDMMDKNSVLAVAGLGRPEMREAAQKNRVFFFKGKKALTAREVYARFEQRINKGLHHMQTTPRTIKISTCKIVLAGP